ncbi:hypothetical protein VST63_12240 [Mycolicibacterium sp. 050232]|uniref:hypothetical protein n=1 Tax=Mycolicibacterium sp. 050232 TaxID=3113982 RepID=UPI002E28EEBB|nr:hypothetical protein [Mycolicibacterium sp. 050232]MED5813129.1 hypothetical protein [Mycolicibacterium sp. 050232]
MANPASREDHEYRANILLVRGMFSLFQAEDAKMRKVTVATIEAAGLAVVSIGFAPPASAAPAGSESAQDVINALEARGYTVIVHKVGGAPLSQCRVSSTKMGHTYSRTDSSGPGDSDNTTVTAKTINVFVSC